MAKIAVQNGLNDYAKYIVSKGHDVEKFNKDEKTSSSFYNSFDAVVVDEFDYNLLDLRDEITDASGINSGILNFQDSVTPKYVINSSILNENYVGKKIGFTSVPTIFANGRSKQQVMAEIDRVLYEIKG